MAMIEGVLARDRKDAGSGVDVMFFYRRPYDPGPEIARDDVYMDASGWWGIKLPGGDCTEWTEAEWLADGYMKKDIPRHGTAVEVLLEI